MKILVDSQVLIWLLHDSKKVGPKSLRALEDADIVYVSIMSFWELAIKFNKNKTRMPYSPQELIEGSKILGLQRLSILDEHIFQLRTAQTPHGDPFDRMLLAQSEAECCYLLTSDRGLLSTKYKTLPVTS